MLSDAISSFIRPKNETPSLGREGRDCKFVAMALSDVPCCAGACRKDGKWEVVKFVIIRAHSAGFGKAPYTAPSQGEKYVAPANAKCLSEKIDNCTMKLYSFQTDGTDKGPRRDDLCFDVKTGDIITMPVNAKSFKRAPGDTRSMFPTGVESLPLGTMVMLHLAPKGSDTITAKRSGIRIQQIESWNQSLYSYIPEVSTLPVDASGAQELLDKRISELDVISKDFQSNNVSVFYLKNLPTNAFTATDATEDTKMVRLGDWGGTGFIDLPVALVRMYTNTQDVEHACALLDLAIQAEGLSVLVFHNNYWGNKDGFSPLLGVPLVHLNKLFGNIQDALEDENGLEFSPGYKFKCVDAMDQQETDDTQAVTYRISAAEAELDDTLAPRALFDFPWVGRDTMAREAYDVCFDLQASESGAMDAQKGVAIGRISLQMPKVLSSEAPSLTRKRPRSLC